MRIRCIPGRISKDYNYRNVWHQWKRDTERNDPYIASLVLLCKLWLWSKDSKIHIFSSTDSHMEIIYVSILWSSSSNVMPPISLTSLMIESTVTWMNEQKTVFNRGTVDILLFSINRFYTKQMNLVDPSNRTIKKTINDESKMKG